MSDNINLLYKKILCLRLEVAKEIVDDIQKTLDEVVKEYNKLKEK